MNEFSHIDSTTTPWQRFSEGIEMLVLRGEPGANRVLLRLAPGHGYPVHHHEVAEEVFVIEGVYEDRGQQFGPGSYLHYPPGTDHDARSSTGCTFLVINAKVPKAA
ncbi:cupin domain-containing protein [Lysobacter korlensis]|uniref:Cupin domain-containing protein n=1 Tax=Lysobacter korlensis TaxID=553636 RepID=A0ABV6RUE2_9GAMM